MQNIFYIGSEEKYQGNLYILKNLSNNQLFIEGDASLHAWDEPSKALIDTTKVDGYYPEYKYIVEKDCKAKHATWEEIKAAGWGKYVINKPDQVANTK